MDGHFAPLSYHARLVADPHRVEAYDRALRRLVRPGDVVLDLGTGTGILAMLAARRGARVHAVESTPIAGLAEELVARNGLGDRVTIHRGDVRALAPVEPVDLVVSDFLGSFLVDDKMLPAVAAAGRWLKPGGRFLPARVRLYVAPITDVQLANDVFDEPMLGLDLSAARAYGTTAMHRVAFAASELAGAAVLYHDFTPPGPAEPLDGGLTLRIERGGTLVGLAGWFVADLAPDVTLSNEPGLETHWDQLFFALPPVPVAAGDELFVRLRYDGIEDDDPSWRWSGMLSRGGAPRSHFAVHSEEWLGERQEVGRKVEPPAPPEESARSLHARGQASYRAERVAEAVDYYCAATRALTPADDGLAADLYEDLGVGLWRLGRFRPAARALLRALDDGTERELSLRLLVSCFFRDGRKLDGDRFLRRYEAVKGPHPEGWGKRRPR